MRYISLKSLTDEQNLGEVEAYWLESRTCYPKFESSSLGLAVIVGGVHHRL